MQTLIDYAKSWVGTPYIWGGDDASGWDCSGLVQECLASVGMDPKGDQTAQGLYEYFLSRGRPKIQAAGALAFYGKPKVIHVALFIDEWRVIEAGGGGSTTKTPTDAAKQNAYVRIRPWNHRDDFVLAVLPFYPKTLSPLLADQRPFGTVRLQGNGS